MHSSKYEAPDAPPDESALPLIAWLRSNQIQTIDAALTRDVQGAAREAVAVAGRADVESEIVIDAVTAERPVQPTKLEEPSRPSTTAGISPHRS